VNLMHRIKVREIGNRNGNGAQSGRAGMKPENLLKLE